MFKNYFYPAVGNKGRKTYKAKPKAFLHILKKGRRNKNVIWKGEGLIIAYLC